MKVSNRPVIGITTSISEAGDQQTVPLAYAEAVCAAGGTPILLPMLSEASCAGPACVSLFELVDGVVIVGGGVISDNMVGDQPRDLEDTPALRDSTDRAVLQHALRSSKPVLGICYGMQFINAFLGGSITADWQEHNGGGSRFRHSPKRGVSNHKLCKIASGSIMQRILQEHPHSEPGSHTACPVVVNSFHLQGISQDMLAPVLTVTALSPDGAVEAFEGRGGLLHGIQWHPEKMLAEGQLPHQMLGIFKDLVDKASVQRQPAASVAAGTTLQNCKL